MPDEFNRTQLRSCLSSQRKLLTPDAIVKFSIPDNRPEDLKVAAGHLGTLPGTQPCKVGRLNFSEMN